MISVKSGLSGEVNGDREIAPPRRLRGVLFDKDGTLIDFQRTWGPAIHHVIHTLAQGDAAKLNAQAECLHFDIAEKRFRATSPIIGSPKKMWEMLHLAAENHPIAGNAQGSYLTLRSKSGLIFGVLNLVG